DERVESHGRYSPAQRLVTSGSLCRALPGSVGWRGGGRGVAALFRLVGSPGRDQPVDVHGVAQLAPGADGRRAEFPGLLLRVVGDEQLAELEGDFFGGDVVAVVAGPVDALDGHHAEGEHQVRLAALAARAPRARRRPRLADEQLDESVVVAGAQTLEE